MFPIALYNSDLSWIDPEGMWAELGCILLSKSIFPQAILLFRSLEKYGVTQQ